MDVSQFLPLIAMLMVAGAFAGLLAGLLGVGGGIVHVPAFYFAFSTLGFGGDQLLQLCLATSLATIVVTSIRSVAAHNKRGAVDWEILRTWAPGIVIGAILGTALAARLDTETLEGAFACIAACIGLYLAFGKQSWRLAEAMPGGATRAGLSGSVGFLSVLMGIGGGSFGVPIMTLYGVPVHRAVATAAGFGLIIAAPSALGFLTLSIDAAPPFTVGAINLPALVLAISMTMITAPIGARLAHSLPAPVLRRLFAGFVLIVAANMARQAFWG